jgi:hypothetical protein
MGRKVMGRLMGCRQMRRLELSSDAATPKLPILGM